MFLSVIVISIQIYTAFQVWTSNWIFHSSLVCLSTYAYARVSYWSLHCYRTSQQLDFVLLVGSSLLHSDQLVASSTRTSNWYHITTYVWIDFSTRHYRMLILLCEWSEPQYFSRMQDHYIKDQVYHPFELSRVFMYTYCMFIHDFERNRVLFSSFTWYHRVCHHFCIVLGLICSPSISLPDFMSLSPLRFLLFSFYLF